MMYGNPAEKLVMYVKGMFTAINYGFFIKATIVYRTF